MSAASPEETVALPLATGTIAVSEKDGLEMRAALAEYLERIPGEDHPQLLVMTRSAPVFLDPAGGLRVGPWLLEARGSDPVLRYREPPTAAGAKAHVAVLQHLSVGEWRWRVREVIREVIRARR